MANNILRQIEFTKTYEDIGVRAPQWQNVAEQISLLSPPLNQAGVHLSVSTGDLQVDADPLLEKVFENLIDNSLRHGEHVRNIEVRYEKGTPASPHCTGMMAPVYRIRTKSGSSKRVLAKTPASGCS